MEYRMLPHGGEKIGVIGMGSSVVGAQKESDIAKTVRAAFDLGVNYFDMAARPRDHLPGLRQGPCMTSASPSLPAGPLWRRLYHRRVRLDDRTR